MLPDGKEKPSNNLMTLMRVIKQGAAFLNLYESHSNKTQRESQVIL